MHFKLRFLLLSPQFGLLHALNDSTVPVKYISIIITTTTATDPNGRNNNKKRDAPFQRVLCFSSDSQFTIISLSRGSSPLDLCSISPPPPFLLRKQCNYVPIAA